MTIRHRLPLAALTGLLLAAAPCQGQDVVAREIRARVERLEASGILEIGADLITASSPLRAAYEGNGFAPLWSDVALRGELARLVGDLEADGLDPRDYHPAGVTAPSAESASPGRAAELDLLRTDALLRVVRDLAVGHTRPELASIAAGLRATEPALEGATLRAMIAPGKLSAGIATYRPSHFVYRGLMDGLARLRHIAAEGGWESVADGPPMMRDSADARVPALRRRLLREDYVVGQSGTGSTFDAGLDQAVRYFQHRHGLNEDGIVGTSTLAALNVPVEERIEQLRVNLERSRWISHALPAEFLAVNTAGAKVYLVRGDSIAFEARSIVGKDYTRTPMFAAELRTIELNPTWTVPPGIVQEILDAIRRDSRYLYDARIRVLDRGGREMDRSRIDFSRYSARSFPYVFEGEPGQTNPLGRIKFLFPNEYSVYLHDTPSRELFARETRTFSHGCIRVADPLRLAELLLEAPDRWSREQLEAAVAQGGTRRVRVPHPMPVLVFYWTASADPDGVVHFYDDPYERDAELRRELDRR
jgi:murein L,D-transpeptidase YcbB/YkuD